MRKYLLLFTLAILSVFAVAGMANALPLTLTGSDGSTYNTSTGNGGGGTDPTFNWNTISGTAAEHSYQTLVTNQSYGPHGKFTTDTNACGRCHQLHQAKTSRLIRFNTATNASAQNPIYGICTYCHNFNGQSTYDVKDGMIWDAQNGIRYATNGGGFERQLVVEGPAQLATLVKANSSHQVNRALNGSSEYIRFNAPGGAAAEHITLKCSSCHNPHGSSNARVLVEKIVYTDSTGANAQTRDTVTNMPQFVTNRFGDEGSTYPDDISTFCGACHSDYLNTANAGTSGSVASGTTGNYRHMINMAADSTLNNRTGGNARNDGSFGYDANTLQLPLGTAAADPIGAPGTVNLVVCTTCHFAHGTGAEMTRSVLNNSIASDQTVTTNHDGTSGAYNLLTASGSNRYETIKNLRMDNRAVCQNCHNRDSVDTTAPALAEVLNPTSNGSLAYSATATEATTKAKGIAATNYIVIRFDQYMSKAAAETITNYVYKPAGGASEALVSAKLMPDGRSVLLTVTTAPTLNSGTITTTTNLKNINNRATVAETVTVK